MSAHDYESFVAIAIVIGSTIGGCLLAVLVAMAASMLIPRELRPACGNTITDPAMILGTILGFVGGWVIAALRPST